MDIEQLLQEFNSKPITYGMEVFLYKFNHQRTKIYFNVHDRSQSSCMRFSIVQRKKYRKMILESIMYYNYELDCVIPFEKLIAWAKSYVPKVIERIELQDAAHIYLKDGDEKVKVRLRVIRKFFKNKGFYEKFDFYAKDPEERRMYDKTFHDLRNKPFDDVCLFLWIFISPFIVDSDTMKVKHANDFDFDQYYRSLNLIIPHHESLLRQIIISTLKDDMLYNIARTLFVFGFPSKYKTSMNAEQEKFFKEKIKLRNASSHTLLQKWKPFAKRFMKVPKDTQGDVVSFFKTVDSTLFLFEQLRILSVPFELQYPINETP